MMYPPRLPVQTCSSEMFDSLEYVMCMCLQIDIKTRWPQTLENLEYLDFCEHGKLGEFRANLREKL